MTRIPREVRDEAVRFANLLHMQAAELRYVISRRRCLDSTYDHSEKRLRHMREVTRQGDVREGIFCPPPWPSDECWHFVAPSIGCVWVVRSLRQHSHYLVC